MSKLGRPTWMTIKDEVRDALSSYEVLYNKQNEIPISLKLEEGAKRLPEDNKDYVAIGYVWLYLKQQGNIEVLCNKTFGFRTKAEANTEQWKLTLYRELLMEIVGTSITHVLMLKQIKNENPDK